MSLLIDKDVGRLAADGFYVIMADYEEVMNVKMHVNYRVRVISALYVKYSNKQGIFCLTTNNYRGPNVG